MLGPEGSDMASGPFKWSPAIQWGPISSSEEAGIRIMITGGTANDWPKPNNFIVQNQDDGAMLVQPPIYTEETVLDEWVDCELGCLGGPGGYASFKRGNNTHREDNVGKSILTDYVQIHFTHFAGGGAPVNREFDVYAQMTSPTIIIGDEDAAPPVPVDVTLSFIRQ
jgi:hypothetical protein